MSESVSQSGRSTYSLPLRAADNGSSEKFCEPAAKSRDLVTWLEAAPAIIKTTRFCSLVRCRCVRWTRNDRRDNLTDGLISCPSVVGKNRAPRSGVRDDLSWTGSESSEVSSGASIRSDRGSCVPFAEAKIVVRCPGFRSAPENHRRFQI